MKRFLFFLFAFFAIGSSVLADDIILQDVISVDDVEITPGEEVEVTVKLVNPPTEGLRSVSFDLYLPEGFTLKKKSANKQNVIVNLSDDQDEAFSVTGKTVKENGVENLQRIRFAILSVSDNEALLEIGDLFSFILVADEDISIDNYQAILGGQFAVTGNITLTGHLGSITYYQPPYTFNIKMAIELSEETSYDAFPNCTDVKVIMNKRVLIADTWNTIYLPFDMDADAIKAAFGEDNDVTIATLTGCEITERNDKIKAINIKFNTTQSTITANTPYLIKLSKGVETFAVEGVSLSDNMTPVSVTADDCTFQGTYSVIEELGKNEPVLFISGNRFYYVSGEKTTRMKSFRGYFTHPELARYISEQSQGANINIFVDDEPTGIRNIITTPGNNNVYDLSGRKLNTDNTNRQKGVYIVNGKKEATR